MLKARRALFVVVAVFCALAHVAEAQVRPDTRRLRCKEVSELVKQTGAVVLSTGRFTFERVVASKNFCDGDESVQRFFAPTRDKRRCFVGQKCVPGFRVENDR